MQHTISKKAAKSEPQSCDGDDVFHIGHRRHPLYRQDDRNPYRIRVCCKLHHWNRIRDSGWGTRHP